VTKFLVSGQHIANANGADLFTSASACDATRSLRIFESDTMFHGRTICRRRKVVTEVEERTDEGHVSESALTNTSLKYEPAFQLRF
jgi:hypothetical protein